MFGIDKGTGSAHFLHFGDDLKRQRGLTGTFRSEDFHNTTARQSPDSERQIQTERAGADNFHVIDVVRIAHAHNRTLTELFFNIGQGRGKRLFPFTLITDAFNTHRINPLLIGCHDAVSLQIDFNY